MLTADAVNIPVFMGAVVLEYVSDDPLALTQVDAAFAPANVADIVAEALFVKVCVAPTLRVPAAFMVMVPALLPPPLKLKIAAPVEERVPPALMVKAAVKVMVPVDDKVIVPPLLMVVAPVNVFTPVVPFIIPAMEVVPVTPKVNVAVFNVPAEFTVKLVHEELAPSVTGPLIITVLPATGTPPLAQVPAALQSPPPAVLIDCA